MILKFYSQIDDDQDLIQIGSVEIEFEEFTRLIDSGLRPDQVFASVLLEFAKAGADDVGLVY